MSFELVSYHVENKIAEIALNRPPLNLLDEKLTLEYFAALDQADQDPDVRVIVLSGNGKGLSAGVDLKWLEKFSAEDMHAFLRLFYVESIRKTRALSKPIIAMVHGYAREGACTLAFGCDMVIASDDATFGYPGVPNLAAPPGMHTWILQRLIGRMKAAELIYTGKAISAAEADRMGLITRVVPQDSLRDETLTLAQEVAAMSPLALSRTRAFMYQLEDMDFAEVPEAALDAVSSAFSSEDSLEARRAFNEKRKPNWTGK
ncbi:enoyl-CoA hydratase/isomerase family protein [Rhodovibrionaceae bacterium A322]